MGCQNYTSIDKLSKELAKFGASVKITHTAPPKGTKFGYTATIIKVSEYQKRFTQLDATWRFTNPTESATYDPSINHQRQM